jgi:hypothetical protein
LHGLFLPGKKILALGFFSVTIRLMLISKGVDPMRGKIIVLVLLVLTLSVGPMITGCKKQGTSKDNVTRQDSGMTNPQGARHGDGGTTGGTTTRPSGK